MKRKKKKKTEREREIRAFAWSGGNFNNLLKWEVGVLPNPIEGCANYLEFFQALYLMEELKRLWEKHWQQH
jgi:hypothetical protein